MDRGKEGRREGPERVGRWRYERKEVSLALPRLTSVSIVARFSTRPSAHETSFTLSLSPLHPPSFLPSHVLLYSSSSLIFALNISQRTGSGRVTYCSSSNSTLGRWRRRPRFSHSLLLRVPRPSKKRGEWREKRWMEDGRKAGRERNMAVCN